MSDDAMYWLIALAGLVLFIAGIRWLWRFCAAVWATSKSMSRDMLEYPWQCRRCNTVSPPEAFVCYGCGAAKRHVFF
jgi:hypothetical protein